MSKVFMAADHNGLELKNRLRDWLRKKGNEVVDLGPKVLDKQDDYPDFGIKVAEAVGLHQSRGENVVGVLVCGSGVGMSVVADKVPGVRAALIHDPAIAEVARRDDDINVLALGADYIDEIKAKQVLSAWLATDFSNEERHVRRINKISEYEQR